MCDIANTGPVRYIRVDPPSLVRRVVIGERTNFTVWIVARPLPRAEDWQWKFYPSNKSTFEIGRPEQVNLRVSDNMAVLVFSDVTMNHDGNYTIWTRNRIGGWQEAELVFRLIARCKMFPLFRLFHYLI